MIVGVNKGINMYKAEDLSEIEPTMGKVQRIVKDWEIQIVAAAASPDLKALCIQYFSLSDSPRRDDMRKEILRKQSAEKAHTSLNSSFTFRERIYSKAQPAFSFVSNVPSPTQRNSNDSSNELNDACDSNNLSELKNSPNNLSNLTDLHSPNNLNDSPVSEIDETKLDLEYTENKTKTEEPSEESAQEPVSMSEESNQSNSHEDVKQEIIRQINERNIAIIDIKSLEKKPWKEMVGCLLDILKTAHTMPPYIPKRPRHTNLVCFNCEKKGHIVKNCPTKTTKCTKKRY